MAYYQRQAPEIPPKVPLVRQEKGPVVPPPTVTYGQPPVNPGSRPVRSHSYENERRLKQQDAHGYSRHSFEHSRSRPLPPPPVNSLPPRPGRPVGPVDAAEPRPTTTHGNGYRQIYNGPRYSTMLAPSAGPDRAAQPSKPYHTETIDQLQRQPPPRTGQHTPTLNGNLNNWNAQYTTSMRTQNSSPIIPPAGTMLPLAETVLPPVLPHRREGYSGDAAFLDRSMAASLESYLSLPEKGAAQNVERTEVGNGRPLPYPIDSSNKKPSGNDCARAVFERKTNSRPFLQSQVVYTTPPSDDALTPRNGHLNTPSKHPLPVTPAISINDPDLGERNNADAASLSDSTYLNQTSQIEHLRDPRGNELRIPPLPSYDFQFHGKQRLEVDEVPPRSNTSAPKISRKPVAKIPRPPLLPPVPPSHEVLPPVSDTVLNNIPERSLSKSNPEHPAKCEKPWSLSALASWTLRTFRDRDVDEAEVVQALASLFNHHVPTLASVLAERFARQTVSNFFQQGLLSTSDRGSISVQPAAVSGVLVQLTGRGCYSVWSHNSDGHSSLGRCYAPRCGITPATQPAPRNHTDQIEEDWQKHWGVGINILEGLDKNEILRQNMLHEIIVKEAEYVRDLDVVNNLIRGGLLGESERAFAPYKKDKFIADVFGSIDPVYTANSRFLLPQLLSRQQAQGPLIRQVGDIFVAWVSKAHAAYVAYAESFPLANKLMHDAKKNAQFQAWHASFEADPRSQRLSILHFLNRPNQRLGRYILMLKTILKATEPSNPDCSLLQEAISRIEQVGQECNAKVGKTEKRVKLLDLEERLSWRSSAERVDLELSGKERQFIKDGPLLRQSDSRLEWVESHVILLDHYLLIAKERKDPQAPAGAWIYVSKAPIRLDHLVIDSLHDEPERKSRKAFGMAFTSALDVTAPTPTSLTSSPSKTSLLSRQSTDSMPPPAVTGLEDSALEGAMYPIRIRHLGKEGQAYTLFASSSEIRSRWGDSLVEAQAQYHQRRHECNLNPFTLRILSDTNFAYPVSEKLTLPLPIKGSITDMALREAAAYLPEEDNSPSLTTARVRCVTRFRGFEGRYKMCIGTENGVFCAESGDVRNWYRAHLSVKKVKQIQVVEGFGIVILLADKNLVQYGLDALSQAASDSERKTGGKLTSTGGVGYFAVGKLADRTLLICKSKRRDGVGSTFDIYEPIFSKTLGSFVQHGIKVEAAKAVYFRDYDSFASAGETSGIDMFQASLAIQCAKVTTLANLRPQGIPSLRTPAHDKVYGRIGKAKAALGMLPISSTEYLLCYDECGVYIDRYGEISRGQVLEYRGKPKSVALHLPFMFAIENSFVEVLHVQTGSSHQVISGVDIRCLDKTHGRVKLGMAHPEREGKQFIVELVMQRKINL